MVVLATEFYKNCCPNWEWLIKNFFVVSIASSFESHSGSVQLLTKRQLFSEFLKCM